MKRVLVCFLILVFLSLGVEAQTPITVGFCDLVKKPAEYATKKVRVRAIYRYGFEWSELYCSDCDVQEKLMWFEPGDEFEKLTPKSVRKKIKWSEVGRTVEIVAVGTFVFGGGYGHMGAYRYKLVADKIEEATVILKDSVSPLPDNLKEKANCSCHLPD